MIFIVSLAVIIHLGMKYKETNEYKYLYAAMYILVLALMQLVEFVLHLYTSNKKSNIYQLASVFILVTFVIQFIAAEVCIYTSGAPIPLCIVDIIFYCILAYSFYSVYKFVGKFDNTQDCSNWMGCKLRWDPCTKIYQNNKSLTALVVLIYVIYVGWTTYLIFDVPLLIVYLLTLFITFVPAFLTGGSGFGSAWCLYAILLSILMIIIDEKLLEKSHIK